MPHWAEPSASAPVEVHHVKPGGSARVGSGTFEAVCRRTPGQRRRRQRSRSVQNNPDPANLQAPRRLGGRTMACCLYHVAGQVHAAGALLVSHAARRRRRPGTRDRVTVWLRQRLVGRGAAPRRRAAGRPPADSDDANDAAAHMASAALMHHQADYLPGTCTAVPMLNLGTCRRCRLAVRGPRAAAAGAFDISPLCTGDGRGSLLFSSLLFSSLLFSSLLFSSLLFSSLLFSSLLF
eukprot:SAG31_NODE_2401_length_5771_cov_90.513223_5_plen_235_part_01